MGDGDDSRKPCDSVLSYDPDVGPSADSHFQSSRKAEEEARRKAHDARAAATAGMPGAPSSGSDFATLVVSIATAALLSLGEIPDPDGGKPEVNTEMARHSIDTLAMLREKTVGNLTLEERDLLDRFLFDLRMKFVAMCQKSRG